MKKYVAIVASLVVLIAGSLTFSHAGSRYSSQPPTVLSPNLTAPWVLQLEKAPRVKTRRAVKRSKSVQKPRRKATRIQTRKAVKRNKVAKRKLRRTTRTVGSTRNTRRASLSSVSRKHRIRPVAKRTPRSKQRAFLKPRTVSKPRSVVRLRKKPPSPKPRGKKFNPELMPQVVNYSSSHKAGTLIVDTQTRFLFLVMKDGSARRYGIGVGKPGFEWAGKHKVSRKAEWPTWTPPKEMIAREAKKGHYIPNFMKGGPKNPLGARALYLGSTLYRIHGTNQPWSIGKAVSSGCIRMRNEDVMDLYERVKVGTQVVVI
ncbi:MAG: L,D-transpeptidase [Rhizobiaceae bacterium]|nr:L,D-transpeptidase [Rhizobiaceae bacterium]